MIRQILLSTLKVHGPTLLLGAALVPWGLTFWQAALLTAMLMACSHAGMAPCGESLDPLQAPPLNPTTGLPMANAAVDVQGTPFGATPPQHP